MDEDFDSEYLYPPLKWGTLDGKDTNMPYLSQWDMDQRDLHSGERPEWWSDEDSIADELAYWRRKGAQPKPDLMDDEQAAAKSAENSRKLEAEQQGKNDAGQDG